MNGCVPSGRRRHRGRIQHWNDTVAALSDSQAECAAWLKALPDNQHTSPTAECPADTENATHDFRRSRFALARARVT
jgi:hypothetical protein